jgi:two-component system sensor histidine kinase ChvG
VRLTSRLLLVSLVTLLLPWAGCQYLRDVETTLRQGQALSLSATATAVAAGLSAADVGSPLYRGRFAADRTRAVDIYAHRVEQRPTLDGFADDWGLPSGALLVTRLGQLSVSYAAARGRGSIYLLVDVSDPEVVYGDAASSDSVRLRVVDDAGASRDLIFATAAPGPLRPIGPDGSVIRQVEGNWQPTSTGYSLEIRLPAGLAGGRLGFLVTDRDRDGSVRTAGTLPDLAAEPGWLIYRAPALDDALARSALPGVRLKLVDSLGYVLGDSGPASAGVAERSSLWVRRLVRLAFGSDDSLGAAPAEDAGRMDLGPFREAFESGAADRRFRGPDGGRVLLASARRVEIPSPALLIAETDTDAILSATDRAATRLVLASFLASITAVLLLLGFAGWLSWRIGRLSGAASRALTRAGEIRPCLPDGRSRDELGDLSRNFSRLLSQVAEYNSYLKTLGQKLTHELRTPMAVVLTSLENLRADPGGPQAIVYLRRAEQGIHRLQSMVSALGAATRVEQAIADSRPESFDLSVVLGELFTAYVDTHPDRHIDVRVPDRSCPVIGSPELLAQMLDKLFENALEFCPSGGRIGLALEVEGTACILRVTNTGSRLADDLESQLFESMVSARPRSSDSPHLGLGLYIARLIARHHGAEIAARNLPGDGGVEICVRIPQNPDGRERSPTAIPSDSRLV